MIHDRAYTRKEMWLHAIRRRNINIARQAACDTYYPIYDNLHQYADNKVHCDCPLCRSKTNPKNKCGCGPAMNWCPADQRQLDDMHLQLGELYD